MKKRGFSTLFRVYKSGDTNQLFSEPFTTATFLAFNTPGVTQQLGVVVGTIESAGIIEIQNGAPITINMNEGDYNTSSIRIIVTIDKGYIYVIYTKYDDMDNFNKNHNQE